MTVYPCTDSRALTLEPNPNVPDSYRVATSTGYVLDYGVYGYVALATQNGWSYQLFSSLRDDEALVEADGCDIVYPLLVTDTAGYELERACDHVARIQPPYITPVNALRDPSVWPGEIPAGAVSTTWTYDFNLLFKDNSYLRTSVTSKNWMTTGLYAPAAETIEVTVDGATEADLDKVYIQLGVHSDILNLSNAGSAFKRYPNVVNKIKLKPGLNTVRSPYGGVIELISEESVGKTIQVTIANAVQTPHFVLGTTTESDWLTLRDAPGATAIIESDLSVTYDLSSDISALSYEEISGIAQYYRDILQIENDLLGISDTETDPVHQLPDGKHRFVNDIQITAGAAHSGFPMMFGNYPLVDPNSTYQRSTDLTWGLCHELGHNNQMSSWSYAYGSESTNNLFCLNVQEQLFGMSRLIEDNRYAKAIAVLNDDTVTDKWEGIDLWGNIVFMDQIRLGFPEVDWDFLSQVMRAYRDMSDSDYDNHHRYPSTQVRQFHGACL